MVHGHRLRVSIDLYYRIMEQVVAVFENMSVISETTSWRCRSCRSPPILQRRPGLPEKWYICVRPTGNYRSRILMQFRSMLCTYNPSLFLSIRDLGTRNYLEHPLALEMVTANRFLHLIHASGYSTSDIQVKEGYFLSRLYFGTHGGPWRSKYIW